MPHPRMMHTKRRPQGRRALAAIGVVVAVLTVAAPALAHVEAEGSTDAEGTTTVTFTFSHGCGQSPTTSLRVQIPAEASDVRAENAPGFTPTVTDAVITWAGGTVPNGTTAVFTATMRLAGTKGDTVYFPTIQSCAQGENAWIEKTADPEAENASPRVVIEESLEPVGGGHAGSSQAAGGTTIATATSTSAKPAATPAPRSETTAPAPQSSASPGTATGNGPSTGLVVAIAVAAIAVAGASAAVVILRRRSGT